MHALLEHGGRTDAAREHYPDAPAPWVDLSTGINPSPWARNGDPVVGLGPLPLASHLTELETAAAESFGAPAPMVAALPGTEIGLRLLRCLDLPGPHRHVAPTYGTHSAALSGSIPIMAGTLEAEAARGGTILLANPNNPDGRSWRAEHLLDVARFLNAAGGRLIVDEAFADATPDISVAPAIADAGNILVFRSFGKFFGLAGLRLGFVIGPAQVISTYRDLLGSWPVSSIALELGTMAYRDRPWIERTRRALHARQRDLDSVLARHGLTGSGDCPLFRLVETDDAAALFDRLARQGILTRPFDYAPTWLRIGLPAGPTELERLDRALPHG